MNLRLFPSTSVYLRRLLTNSIVLAGALLLASPVHAAATAKAPVVTLTAGAARVFTGEKLTLRWSAQDSTSCTASGAWSGAKSLSGTDTLAVTKSGNLVYALTCTGAGGSSTKDAKVLADEPALSLTRSFSPNAVTISTSDGAPYGHCDFWKQNPSQCVDETNFGYGPTRVLQVYICLSGEVSAVDCSGQPEPKGALSQQMLAAMESRIAAFAGTGVRIIPRFTYNFGPIGSTAKDAPIDVILEHLDQIAPILVKNKDLVLALEAGFIGTWGEWHDSTNGNDAAGPQKLLLDRERKYFSGLFPILVRYPGDLIQYTGTATPVAGLGLHDDYYASDSDDGSTWNPCNPGAGYCLNNYSAEQLESYASAVSASGVFAGEFGALDANLQSCDALDAYSYAYNAQSITLQPYPANIGAELEDEGCALSFYNKVGVRIELHTVTVIGNPVSGGRLDLAVTLSNAGYGNVKRPRPAKVIFVSNGSQVAEIPVPLADLDLRKLKSAPKPAWRTFEIHLQLPADFRLDGSSLIALVFPDPAPSLNSNPAYALPLNSIEDSNSISIFDPTTGYNVVAHFDAF